MYIKMNIREEKKSTLNVVLSEKPELEELNNSSFEYTLGQWVYWIEKDGVERLGCITHIGSNNIEIYAPKRDNSQYWDRIHVKELNERVRKCEDPERQIQQRVNVTKANIDHIMGEIREVCRLIGVSPSQMITEHQETNSTALAIMNASVNPDDLKNSLVKAKEKTLPDLYSQLEEEHLNLAQWMGAEALALQCQVGSLNNIISEIEDKIFNVSLYAGLAENIVQICEGAVAGRDEKLRLLQRRLYMDEECLMDYDAGGMDISNLEAFDNWLARSHNRDRILPFQKCIVTMRVRRKRKEREARSAIDAWVNLNLAKHDTMTFMFMRNGDNLYRMNTDINFGEFFFPSSDEFDKNEPQMVSGWRSRFSFMGISEYNVLTEQYKHEKAEYDEKRQKYKQWEENNPGQKVNDNPYREWYWSFHFSGHSNFHPEGWKVLEPDFLYYDEAMQEVSDRVRQFNRVALVVQGILDRSPTFQPHNPVKLWTAEGFEFLDLVYDASGVLTYGDAPDFEDYAEKLRQEITPDSILMGQQQFYKEQQAEKEIIRRENCPHYRFSEYERELSEFLPKGDPGPTDFVSPAKIIKKSRIKFEWMRERRRRSSVYEDWGDVPQIKASCTVPIENLFNVSAYKPGDFKQFFQDPRTREKYLRWAPVLMACEDYHYNKNQSVRYAVKSKKIDSYLIKTDGRSSTWGSAKEAAFDSYEEAVELCREGNMLRYENLIVVKVAKIPRSMSSLGVEYRVVED